MKERFNTGCGKVTLIELNAKGDALLQKSNGEYVVAFGYTEDEQGVCSWNQGHYFGKEITPAVLEFAEIDVNSEELTLLQVLQNADCELAVYNNVFDNEYATFCNTKLTDYGKRVYKDLLSLKVVLGEECIVIDIDSCENYEELDEKLEEMFNQMAGYISASEYNLRFKN